MPAQGPEGPLPGGGTARGGAHPLSVSQEQLWLISRLAPGRPVYHEAIAFEHLGRLDPAPLAEAVQWVVDRHEAWRGTFHLDPVTGEASVHLGRPPLVEVPALDLAHLPWEEAERQAARWVAARAAHPYRLEAGPLVRAQLVRLPQGRDRLYLMLHHIAFDGVSMYRVVLPQLADAYGAARARRPLPAVPAAAGYGDFARWERGWISSERAARRLAWWVEHLAGAEPLALPLDRPPPPLRSWRGSALSWTVDPATVAALEVLAAEHRSNLFHVVAAAFAAVLARYSQQDDVVFATAADTRQRPEHREVVGYCVTPLLIRVAAGDDPSFTELLARVRAEVLDGLDHLVPFERVVRAASPARRGADTPLFNAMIILQPPLEAPPAGWRPIAIDGNLSDAMGASKFLLELGLDRLPDGSLQARLIYDRDLWDQWRAEALARHWSGVLEVVADDAGRRLSQLVAPGPAERQQLAAANATDRPVPPVAFHRLVEQRAALSPGSVAITAGADTVTYEALDRWADAIAGELVALGAGPGAVVAVCVARSPGMIAALLGTMKSGAASLPLDPTQPPSRLAGMVADAGATALLAGPGVDTAEIVGPTVRVQPLRDPPAPGSPVVRPPVEVGPTDACYVLFTSGSTGRPKGTVIPHGALVNVVAHFRDQLDVAPRDAVLALTTISFDIAMLEMFLPLVAGARAVIAPAGTAADGVALGRLIDRAGVTVVQATPTTWRALVASGWPGRRGVVGISGGEPLAPDLAADLLALGVSLYNAYGPTETTIWSTVDRVEAGGPVTIGRPIANTRVVVVGPAGEEQPVGVPGELIIAGAGVAAGYLGRPELTAERFVADPTLEGAVAYRTGDRVRWRIDGRLEHLGRLDDQVKLRGHRIEPAEIAQLLRDLPGVGDAAVVRRDDTPGGRLVAYVTGDPPEAAAIRAALGSRLPPAMVPAAFVTLEALPTNPAGKLDRGALPAPASHGRSAPEALHTPLEQELSTVWAELLGIEAVGAGDDFFDLGGHSMLAVQLLHRVSQRWGVTLPVSALWAGGNSVRAMAALVDRSEGARPVGPAGPAGGRPLFMLFPHAWGQLAARHFAAALGDDPVVALSVPVEGWRYDPGRGVEQLAATLAADMRAQQPAGPYALAGYSFAGSVAYEAAGQLRAAGHEVEWLGLVDAAAPSAVRAHDQDPTWAQRARRRLRGGVGYVARDVHRLLQGWANDLRLMAHRPVRPVFDWGGAMTMLAAYAPGGHDVLTTVFRTEGPDGMPEDLGWGSVHRGVLEVVAVPGDHDTVLSEPAVAEVATSVADRLRAARLDRRAADSRVPAVEP